MNRLQLKGLLAIFALSATGWSQRILMPQAPTDPGPAWASYTSNYASFAVNLNGYPANDLFGAGTVFLPEAIRGAVSIPSNATGNNHASGVAGYALTNSTSKGAVGVFGAGIPNVASASVWGANFAAGNCPSPPGGTCHNNGLNNITSYVTELDMGITAGVGGAAINTATMGLYIVNGGEASTTNPVFDGIRLTSLNVPLTNAFATDAGAAMFALNIGPVATGNGQASQKIVMSGTSSGGSTLTATQFVDSSGNFIFQAGSGGLVALEDNAGHQGLQVIPSGTTPYVQIVNTLRNATYPQAQLAGLTAVAGAQVYCTDCTTAATCAGAGTGHAALFNGTAWTCQ